MPGRDIRPQLEAIRAQAVAIVASIDAIVGAPPEERCCENPKLKTVETYTTRTTYCENCRNILSKASLEPSGKGEDHA